VGQWGVVVVGNKWRFDSLLLLVLLLVESATSASSADDPYQILGVTRNSQQNEIQKKYRELCLKYHPDKSVQKSSRERDQCENMFKEVQKAYLLLARGRTP
jgi:preprotein translocase subunit Sec63